MFSCNNTLLFFIILKMIKIKFSMLNHFFKCLYFHTEIASLNLLIHENFYKLKKINLNRLYVIHCVYAIKFKRKNAAEITFS